MLGNIHSIDSFSTLDGKGIRFVVFMQGCKMRCKYCHNPDTWNIEENKLIDSKQLVEEILKNKDIYVKSGGGVTFTGGEPLLQQDFLIEICKMLKKEEIHISIDTAGYVKIDEKLKELVNYVDTFLLDIK